MTAPATAPSSSASSPTPAPSSPAAASRPLAGQRVVVLGGTSGIGLATAALAARHGAEAVVASSSENRVKEALGSLPDGSRGEVADLTDSTSVGALFERLGAFDHLVYTAGEPLTLQPLDGLDVEVARSFFSLRYFGALGAASAAVPYLRAGGSITLTSGTAGLRPGGGWAVAASICGAVDSMVRAMAVELAPVRVNAVRPGILRSPLWSRLGEEDRERMYEQTAASVPLGRIGEVEDAAEAYVHLIGQRFTTGTILTVDGGTLLV